MGRPKFDLSNLIDSNVDLFMYLVRYMKRSTFELGLTAFAALTENTPLEF